MSELATEISGNQEQITSSEFLGKSFADRKNALLQVESFRKFTEQALFDSVSVFVGQKVNLTFRPSTITTRQYPNMSVSCYSMRDEERAPINRDVTILDVIKDTAVVSAGEFIDESYDAQWTVGIRNIVSIDQIENETI